MKKAWMMPELETIGVNETKQGRSEGNHDGWFNDSITGEILLGFGSGPEYTGPINGTVNDPIPVEQP